MNSIKATILTAILSLLFTSIAGGQTPKIDSLETLLNKHTRLDTVKVNLINRIAYEIFYRDPLKAKNYAEKSWDISMQINYPKGKTASLWVSGLASLQSDKKESAKHFREALKIAEEIDDKVGMCNYWTAIGNVTRDFGDIKGSNEAHERALQIALELKDNSLIIKVRLNISINMSNSNMYLESAKQIQEMIIIAKEINDEALLARSYGNLASIYRIQGNLPTALEYYLSSLKLNEKINDYPGIFFNLTHIAGLQTEQKEFDAALKTIQKAFELSKKNGDSSRLSNCFTNIGNIYQQMNNPEALDYFQKAIKFSKNKNISQTINNLMSIGVIYTSNKEFEKALQNFDEALALAQKINLKSAICKVYIKTGSLYIDQKKYDLAKQFIQNALIIAENIHYTELQKDCNDLLSKIYAAIGNYKEAFAYHTQYKILYDSLFNEKNTRKIALLESSYQFDKERQVYELEKSSHELRIKNQQQTILSLVVISLLIILLSFVIYWSARMRKRVLQLEIKNINKELESNQKAIAVAKLKLVQNSERDAYNIKILEDIGKNTAGEDNNNLNSLISNYKLQTHLSNWKEFETLFTKVNSSFWDKLNKIQPPLTPNERKLCVFLKLNMNNKDIALITFQSEEALKKSRLRLRKKFDLERSTNLVAFIQNL